MSLTSSQPHSEVFPPLHKPGAVFPEAASILVMGGQDSSPCVLHLRGQRIPWWDISPYRKVQKNQHLSRTAGAWTIGAWICIQ